MASPCVRALEACLPVAVLLAGGSAYAARAAALPEPPIPAGKPIRLVNSGGILRTYRVYRPRGLAGAAPLVVMLHGGFGDPCGNSSANITADRDVDK